MGRTDEHRYNCSMLSPPKANTQKRTRRKSTRRNEEKLRRTHLSGHCVVLSSEFEQLEQLGWLRVSLRGLKGWIHKGDEGAARYAVDRGLSERVSNLNHMDNAWVQQRF